jgi:hypothetical protein
MQATIRREQASFSEQQVVQSLLAGNCQKFPADFAAVIDEVGERDTMRCETAANGEANIAGRLRSRF